MRQTDIQFPMLIDPNGDGAGVELKRQLSDSDVVSDSDLEVKKRQISDSDLEGHGLVDVKRLRVLSESDLEAEVERRQKMVLEKEAEVNRLTEWIK